uniref:NADH-ubiquinone oxidoreductase chain 4 n=1 Tax=Siphonaria gigas TaxID=1087063 RepID=G8HSF8_9GAST|nr:NADH dehydrogenase subunit 4 [Siphonaria gigas]AEQ93915.1 NADH dehydrogenase subunit 4 [Siphonaria gigas]
MVVLLFGVLFSFLVSFSWGSAILSSVLLTIYSLLCLNSSFSLGYNLMFSSSSMSALLIFLSCLLCFLSLLSTPMEKSPSYIFCILFLLSVLLMAFSVSNIISFYVFFEASLIPTLILIIGWGYQPERLQAGTYMMLYTVSASLPLLVIILWRALEGGSMITWFLGNTGSLWGGYFLLVIYGAFLVKLPMYTVHLWLPKAHVEAPLAGSMILAGILLKLGGYGVFQMNLCFSLFQGGWGYFIVAVSMWGGLLSTLMCLRQVDVKSLVAYSSVGHMGLVSSGFLMDSTWGVSSAVITMLAHGFSSSALFCLAYFTYEKCHTRSIPYIKGFLQLYPALSLFWFVLCCVNMAAPPSINLVGELMVVPALFSSSVFLVVIMGLMVFFSAAYNMYLYTSVNHGQGSTYVTSGLNRYYEMMSLFCHLVPLLLLLKGDLFFICWGEGLS